MAHSSSVLSKLPSNIMSSRQQYSTNYIPFPYDILIPDTFACGHSRLQPDTGNQTGEIHSPESTDNSIVTLIPYRLCPVSACRSSLEFRASMFTGYSSTGPKATSAYTQEEWNLAERYSYAVDRAVAVFADAEARLQNINPLVLKALKASEKTVNMLKLFDTLDITMEKHTSVSFALSLPDLGLILGGCDFLRLQVETMAPFAQFDETNTKTLICLERTQSRAARVADMVSLLEKFEAICGKEELLVDWLVLVKLAFMTKTDRNHYRARLVRDNNERVILLEQFLRGDIQAPIEAADSNTRAAHTTPVEWIDEPLTYPTHPGHLYNHDIAYWIRTWNFASAWGARARKAVYENVDANESVDPLTVTDSMLIPPQLPLSTHGYLSMVDAGLCESPDSMESPLSAVSGSAHSHVSAPEGYIRSSLTSPQSPMISPQSQLISPSPLTLPQSSLYMPHSPIIRAEEPSTSISSMSALHEPAYPNDATVLYDPAPEESFSSFQSLPQAHYYPALGEVFPPFRSLPSARYHPAPETAFTSYPPLGPTRIFAPAVATVQSQPQPQSFNSSSSASTLTAQQPSQQPLPTYSIMPIRTGPAVPDPYFTRALAALYHEEWLKQMP